MTDWMNAKAWPFEEARKLVKRFEKTPPKKGYVLFETGYGPSGLPHIGTFGEVLRTTMVRHAFTKLSNLPTKLICFSDDMDGLRRVPTNIPNQQLIAEHLNKPLTQVPDPYEKYESFAHHNNARLRQFLDRFEFDYEFVSSTETYQSGRFDQGLQDMLENYDRVMKIMLPSLREQRAADYSPFMPIDPDTNEVLQVPITDWDCDSGTITYRKADQSTHTTKITGGRCKLQWKPDWGLRWHVLGVDYEMSGKDLIDSVKLSSAICRALGSQPPDGFTYELFLDEHGAKISKSKGNGLSMEEWLRYGPESSLAYFMYGKPKTGKRLYFDVIPRNVDEYQAHLSSFERQSPAEQIENPLWHIHQGIPPQTAKTPISFSMLLNLVAASNSADRTLLWGFISRYLKGAEASTMPALDQLVDFAIAYYQDFVLPNKHYRIPNEKDRAALVDLKARLASLDKEAQSDLELIQNQVYDVGMAHDYPALRDWFKAQYQCLLGQDSGPRIGSFYVIYGIDRTLALIDEALNRKP